MGDFNSVSAAEEVSSHGKLDKRRCAGLTWGFQVPALLGREGALRTPSKVGDWTKPYATWSGDSYLIQRQ